MIPLMRSARKRTRVVKLGRGLVARGRSRCSGGTERALRPASNGLERLELDL